MVVCLVQERESHLAFKTSTVCFKTSFLIILSTNLHHSSQNAQYFLNIAELPIGVLFLSFPVTHPTPLTKLKVTFSLMNQLYFVSMCLWYLVCFVPYYNYYYLSYDSVCSLRIRFHYVLMHL